MTDNGDNEWVTACIVDGGGGVDIIDPIFLFARQSHHAPRIVTVPVLLLVGIIRVHYTYLNTRRYVNINFLVLTSYLL
jgi:hypothetical protein